MKILGVTGTNGKTTTAYLTYQILNKLGKKTAYIGTIGFYIPGEDVLELPNTTPNILDLYELLLTAKDRGCKAVIMEVSSHALDQERIKGIEFEVGAFTNLTQDHLDYHKTMEKYLEAKLLFVKQLKGNLIVNVDDSYGKVWLDKYDNCVTLGKNGKDYTIKDSSDTKKGTLLDVSIYNKDYNAQNNANPNLLLFLQSLLV